MKIVLDRSLYYMGEEAKTRIFGRQDVILGERFFAFLLAMSPILQHYKGPIGNAGITAISVSLLFYVMKGMMCGLMRGVLYRGKEIALVFPLMIFSLYKATVHGVNMMNLLHAFVIIAYYLLIAEGYINLGCVLRMSYGISVAASILMLLQNISYYLFGVHIQTVPVPLLLPESSDWIGAVQTGHIAINGAYSALYRPSAFFLEPSHMFLYLFPVLYLILLSPDMNRWKKRSAVLLSVAMILSTSGMGIMIVAMGWVLYYSLGDGKRNQIKIKNILKGKNLAILCVAIVVAVIVARSVPTLWQSVERILSGDAISGRVTRSSDLLDTLSGGDFLLGVTNTLEGIEFNMSGFAATLYKFGVIGIVLSYTFYVYSALRLDAPYNWIGRVILVVSFFSAHTHGTLFMLYYVMILLRGCHARQSQKGVWEKNG